MTDDGSKVGRQEAQASAACLVGLVEEVDAAALYGDRRSSQRAVGAARAAIWRRSCGSGGRRNKGKRSAGRARETGGRSEGGVYRGGVLWLGEEGEQSVCARGRGRGARGGRTSHGSLVDRALRYGKISNMRRAPFKRTGIASSPKRMPSSRPPRFSLRDDAESTRRWRMPDLPVVITPSPSFLTLVWAADALKMPQYCRALVRCCCSAA